MKQIIFSKRNLVFVVISLLLSFMLGVSGIILNLVSQSRPLLDMFSYDYLASRKDFGFVVMFLAITSYLYMVFAHDTTFRIISSIRLWIYDSISFKPISRIQNLRHADILNRIMQNTETLDGILLKLIAPLFTFLSILILWLWFLAHAISLDFALKITFIVSMLFLSYFVISKRLIALLSSLEEEQSKMRISSIEMREILKQIIVFNGKRRFLKNIYKKTSDFYNIGSVIDNNVFLMGLYGTIATISILLTIVYKLLEVGNISFLDIIVISSLFSIFALITQSKIGVLYFFDVLVSLRKIKQIFIEDNAESKELTTKKDFCANDGVEIYVKGISFVSSRDEKIIDEVSLTIKKNSTIKITGTSGSGKSTFLNIIGGFNSCFTGEVLFNNEKLSEIKEENIVELVTLVPQDYHLFDTSIAENMKIANPKANNIQMKKALEETNLLDWVENLKDGLDTLIGSSGISLSGGQIKRFSLACALLRNTPILLIDEPTANLDKKNALDISKLINKISEEKTTVIVSHYHNELLEASETYNFSLGKLTTI